MDERELELERKKPEFAQAELKLRRDELALKEKTDQARRKTSLLSPLGVAVVGGLLALFSGIFGSLVQGCNNAHLQDQQAKSTSDLERQKQEQQLAFERQKQEQQLVFKAIDT